MVGGALVCVPAMRALKSDFWTAGDVFVAAVRMESTTALIEGMSIARLQSPLFDTLQRLLGIFLWTLGERSWIDDTARTELLFVCGKVSDDSREDVYKYTTPIASTTQRRYVNMDDASYVIECKNP